MGRENNVLGPAGSPSNKPALRFLVESALQRVKSGREPELPRDREAWIKHLSKALVSESNTSHKTAIASLLMKGLKTEDFYEHFVPAAARYLGELWVKDEISFVDVTIGAGRLQALFRESPEPVKGMDRAIPLGQSVLMTIPVFEDHSLGAFLAADQLRRHGVWVHMGIGLRSDELAELIATRRFAAIGLSVATIATLDKVTEMVDYLRHNVDCVPPIVVGGRVVTDPDMVTRRTGADHAVRSAREAIEKCGLATVGKALASEDLG